MKLIPEWRRAWRMLSVQANTINVALLAGWSGLPARMQDAIPVGAVVALAIALLVLGTIGRIVAQPKLHTASMKKAPEADAGGA